MNRALLLFFSKADEEKLLELNIDEKLLGGCFLCNNKPLQKDTELLSFHHSLTLFSFFFGKL